MITQKKEFVYNDVKILLNLSVSSGSCRRTQEVLDKYSDKINAADNFGMDGEEGRLFAFALTTSPEMLKILIDNYVEMVIEKQETDKGRKVKEKLLSEMLERKLDESVYEYDDLSEEYKELLEPWLLSQDEMSDDENLFSTTLKEVKEDLSKIDSTSLTDTLSLTREESSESEQSRSSSSAQRESGTTLNMIKENLSDHGFFTLPYFHQHLDRVGLHHATEDDMRKVLAELESLQSRLHYVYSGSEYKKNKELVERQIENVKFVLADDMGDFEFQERVAVADSDSHSYFSVLQEKNSSMLSAVRQNLSDYGFRLQDEVITLDEALVSLEKISSGLGYVYSGQDYKIKKEFIENQITNIKLSTSTEVEKRADDDWGTRNFITDYTDVDLTTSNENGVANSALTQDRDTFDSNLIGED